MSMIWRLALRNIIRNLKRTFLTVLLISCSAAALIFTDGFMTGMSQNMVKSATRLYPGDGQIHHPKYLEGFDAEYNFKQGDILQRLTRQPLIEAATARTISSGMISSSANVLSIQAVGIMAQQEQKISKLKGAIIEGQYLSGQKKSDILIGYRLAKKLEVKLGDRLVLSLPQLNEGDINQELFRVSGIFRFNAKAMDENFIFLDILQAQNMMNAAGVIQEVAFNFIDPKNASNHQLTLWQEFESPTTQARGWDKIMPELASMLEMTNFSLLIIGFILFLIASLGVVNAMFMSIYERIWEIGVLKAIGTTQLSIFKLILAEGFLLALISAVCGTLMGITLNFIMMQVGVDYSEMEFSGVSVVEPIKTVIRSVQFFDIPIWVVVLTLLACVYPAWFASKIVPSEALHKSL